MSSEGDLAQAERDRVAEAVHVVARGEARQAREEHRRDRDREHPLREHVDPEGGVDRARRELRIDEARGEERVDERLKLIRPRPIVTGHHQHEDAADGRVAPVDHDAGAARRGPRSQGSGSSTWITVPTTIEPA